MASPRTRRVLHELKPKDANNVSPPSVSARLTDADADRRPAAAGVL